MPRDRECVVIDDVGAALSTMTPLGRTLVADTCQRIRDAVRAFAVSRNWSVVAYDSYVNWASEIMMRKAGPWLILDPLFMARADMQPRLWQTLRITRTDRGPREESPEPLDRLAQTTGSDPIGVLDDAAGSGSTLRYVVRRVQEAGTSVGHVLLCASTRAARDTVRQSLDGTMIWDEFLPRSDWRIIHLRDACPYLPYTGRRTGQTSLAGTDGVPVEIRYPSTHVSGSLWQVLQMSSPVRAAMTEQYRSVTAGLSAAIGRDATVFDLPMLGRGVPALVAPAQEVSGVTCLRAMYGHSAAPTISG